MPDDLIIVDEDIDALSEAQMMNCFMRALHAIGVEFSVEGDGIENIDVESEALLTPELRDAFEQELKQAAAAQFTSSLLLKGAILTDGVDERGNVRFIPNPEFQDEG